MQIELSDEVVNGTGTNVYAVAVTDFDGTNLGTAIWLADSEEHLEEQMHQFFIHDNSHTDNIEFEYRIELIGNTVKQ